MSNTLTFELGERRRVTNKVWINGADDFALENPTWELKRNAREATGTCELTKEGGTYFLAAEVQPKSKGLYTLQYSFTVGTEIIKKSTAINVI